MRKTVEQRFFEKVDKNAPNGCWEWTAGKDGDDYGIFRVSNTKQKRTHRFSYEFFKGLIPEGKMVCHTCDNPRCVNPDHLWLGTQKENMKDCVRKGRTANGDNNGSRKRPNKLKRGSENPLSKLTEIIVKNARDKHNQGSSITSLAIKYGVSTPAMFNAINRNTWKHVS